MSEHTPGNWNWHTSNSWRRLYSDQGRGKQVIVLLPTINPRDAHEDLASSEEDMRLIAAAPDLLAACKVYLAAINSPDYGWAIDECARASVLIAAAVAKAEGRP